MIETLAELYQRLSGSPEELSAEWRKDIAIDTDNIDEALATSSEIHAKWGTLALMAESMAGEAEEVKDVAWAHASEQARNKLDRRTGAKVTEARIQEIACQDDVYRALAKEYRDAKALATAFRQIEEYMSERQYAIHGLNKRQIAKKDQYHD
jgi:hypothetical protein